MASFNGNGYLEFNSQPLKEGSSFGFVFSSILPEGILILSTFAGERSSDQRDFYSIVLRDGHVVVSIPNQPPFVTEEKVDDGISHTIVLVKSQKRLVKLFHFRKIVFL